MLTFNLKKKWFEKIKCGEKTHEYRVFNRYWAKRLLVGVNNQFCVFCMGYPKRDDKDKRILAKILECSIIDGRETDLEVDRIVFDIHFELVKEA